MLKNIFPSEESFNNAKALTYMLNLNPLMDENHRKLLLYTQDGNTPPPKDTVEMYHTLDVANVPTSMIRNE